MHDGFRLKEFSDWYCEAVLYAKKSDTRFESWCVYLFDMFILHISSLYYVYECTYAHTTYIHSELFNFYCDGKF